MIKKIFCCLMLLSLVTIPVKAEEVDNNPSGYEIVDKNFGEISIKDSNGVVFDLNVTSEDKKELSIGQVLSAQEINKLKDNYSESTSDSTYAFIGLFAVVVFAIVILFG